MTKLSPLGAMNTRENGRWRDRPSACDRDKLMNLKDVVDVFDDGGLVDGRHCTLADHVVDGRDDVQHLVTPDHSVAVDVIQAKRPFQLLFHRTASQHRQTRHEVLPHN